MNSPEITANDLRSAMEFTDQFHALILFAFLKRCPYNHIVRQELPKDQLPQSGTEYLELAKVKTLDEFIEEARFHKPSVTVEEISEMSGIPETEVACMLYSLHSDRRWFGERGDEAITETMKSWRANRANGISALDEIAKNFIHQLRAVVPHRGSYSIEESYIKTKKVIATPYIRGEQTRLVKPSDALAIFNSSRVSKSLQLIAITTNDISHDEDRNGSSADSRGIFKVWDNFSIDKLDKKAFKPGSIHAIVVLYPEGEPHESSSQQEEDPSDEANYVHVEIRFGEIIEKLVKRRRKKGDKQPEVETKLLDKVTISFTVSGEVQSLRVISILETHLGLFFRNYEETSLKGDFKIEGASFEEATLLHCLINDNVISRLIYTSDSKKPWPAKTNLNMKLTESPIEFRMEQRRRTTDANNESFFIVVSFDKAQNQTDIARLKKTLRAVIHYYNQIPIDIAVSSLRPFIPYMQMDVDDEYEKRDSLFKFSDEFIEDGVPFWTIRWRRWHRLFLLCYGGGGFTHKISITAPSAQSREISADPNLNAKDRLSELKRLYPDMYDIKGIGISRILNPDLTRPKAIRAQDRAYWEAQNRTVFELPAGSGRLFVCPDNKFRYPGIARIDTGPGSVVEIAKCFSTPRINPNGSVIIQGASGSNRRAPNNTLRTMKVLERDRNGELPTGLGPLFKRVRAIRANRPYVASGMPGPSNAVSAPPYETFRRLGAAPTNSRVSMIHCILRAINDPSYLSRSEADKEVYAIQLFNSIATPPNSDDELFNSSNYASLRIISQELYEVSRGAEATRKALSLIQDASGRYFYRALEDRFKISIFMFDVNGVVYPRSKFYPIRMANPDRPAICLLLNMGTESDHRISFPHYEIICGIRKTLQGEETVTKFERPEVDELWSIYYDGLTFLKTEVSKLSLGYPLSLIRPSLRGQYVDENGKVRAFYYDFNPSGIMKTMMIVVPPSQPLKIRMMKGKFNSITSGELLERVLPVLHLPISSVSVRSVKVRDSDIIIKYVNGYWLQGNTIFIPVADELKVSEQYPEHPEPHLDLGIEAKGRAAQFRDTKKIAEFLEQIIKHAFWLKRMEEPDLTLEVFLRDYCFISPEPYEVSDVKYDVLKPNYRDFILELSARCSSFVNFSMIRITSSDLEAKLLYTLSFWLKSLRGLQITHQPEKLKGEFQNVSDFALDENTRVFHGIASVESALMKKDEFMMASAQVRTLHTEPNPEPVIYKRGVFLLQRVEDGSVYSAYAVVKKWKANKINTGYKTEPYVGALESIKFWKLTNDLKLETVDSEHGEFDILVEDMINTKRYSALLMVKSPE